MKTQKGNIFELTRPILNYTCALHSHSLQSSSTVSTEAVKHNTKEKRRVNTCKGAVIKRKSSCTRETRPQESCRGVDGRHLCGLTHPFQPSNWDRSIILLS